MTHTTYAQICKETADTLERVGASAASVEALRRRCNTYHGDVTFNDAAHRWTWTVYENGKAVEQGHAGSHDVAEDELAARLSMLIPLI